MANLATALLLLSFVVNIAAAAESPAPTPAPASHPSPANPPQSPSPTPAPASHPSPPNPPQSPSPTPAPSTPSPTERDDGGAKRSDVGSESSKSWSGGMSSGKKAGIAIGVMVGGVVVVLGALVYKKRRHNIQRSKYGYAARRELL